MSAQYPGQSRGRATILPPPSLAQPSDLAVPLRAQAGSDREARDFHALVLSTAFLRGHGDYFSAENFVGARNAVAEGRNQRAVFLALAARRDPTPSTLPNGFVFANSTNAVRTMFPYFLDNLASFGIPAGLGGFLSTTASYAKSHSRIAQLALRITWRD